MAAPESANNAGAQTSFIPLLAMGIPPNPVMALMLGAMTIHGIVPGPKVMTERPDLFWGMIASMWLGNLMLIIINLPLIGIWVKFLQIPYRWLYSVILVFCCIGVYTVNNTTTDVLVMAVFGLFGYLLIKIRCEPAPLILGFILGPMLEENFRRSLIVSRGSWWVFLERPICAGFLALSLRVPAGRAAARHPQGPRRSLQGGLRSARQEIAGRLQLAIVVACSRSARKRRRWRRTGCWQSRATGGWRRTQAPGCRRRVPHGSWSSRH